MTPGEVARVTCTNDDTDTVLFNNTVSIGRSIAVRGSPLPISITCHVESNGATVQRFTFDTSGQVDLFLKDSFCSLELDSCNENDCTQRIVYTYDFSNIGQTDMDITVVERTRNGEEEDLLELVPDRELSPGDVTTVIEPELIDLCRAATFEISVRTEAEPPAGSSCFADDEYSFSTAGVVSGTRSPTAPSAPPTLSPSESVSIPVDPTQEAPPPPTSPSPVTPPPTSPSPVASGDDCAVSVEASCSVDKDGGHCDAITPIATRCEDKPTELVMRYNGGNCSQSFNIQGVAGLFACEDYQGGPPTNEGVQTYMVATDIRGLGINFFSGFVSVGQDISFRNNGLILFSSMNVTIYSSDDRPRENILQTMIYHSSCSDNLFLKDRFGSIQLVAFINDLQGVVSCYVNSTFTFSITNEGEVDANLVRLISEMTPHGTLDLTGEVRDQIVTPGSSFVVTQPVQIDMTVRQSYSLDTTIVGRSPGGNICENTDFLEFTVGTPVPNSPTSSPTPLPTPDPETTRCELEIKIDCVADNGLTNDCQDLSSMANNRECINNDIPEELVFLYTGGSCSASDNEQSNFQCEDVGGGPNGTDPVYISIDGAIESVVELGGVFRATGTFGDSISVVISTVRDGAAGTTLQELRSTTRCTEGDDLSLLTNYGALQLVAFENESQGMVSIFADIILTYRIENTGLLDAEVTSALRNSALSGEEELLLSPRSIGPGGAIIFTEAARINLAESALLTLDFTYNVEAVNRRGLDCPASDDYSFTIA